MQREVGSTRQDGVATKTAGVGIGANGPGRVSADVNTGLDSTENSPDAGPADATETGIVDPTGEPIDEVAESAFRAEARDRGELPVAATRKETAVEETGPLPKLDDLVKRIPPEVRETLDELFRAKFVTVKRVSPKALK